jgi:hypothetical protein
MLSSLHLRSTSIDRHDIKIKAIELTTNNGSNRNHVTKYVIATPPASQHDVPPSTAISAPAGHIQHASASDAFGVGSGNANDSDCRTALAASSLGQGLTVDAMACLLYSAKNIGSAGAPTAPGGLRENGGDTTGIGKAFQHNSARNSGSVVSMPVASPFIQQSLSSDSRLHVDALPIRSASLQHHDLQSGEASTFSSSAAAFLKNARSSPMFSPTDHQSKRLKSHDIPSSGAIGPLEKRNARKKHARSWAMILSRQILQENGGRSQIHPKCVGHMN